MGADDFIKRRTFSHFSMMNISDSFLTPIHFVNRPPLGGGRIYRCKNTSI